MSSATRHDRLMKQKEAAAYLGVDPRTFRRYDDVPRTPLPGSTSKPIIRYRQSDLDAWLRDRAKPSSRRKGRG
jgi:predicted DNA-binding transcriptional regulator AlpA